MLSLFLLAAVSMASPFEGCEVHVVGAQEVVKCEGVVTSYQDMPAIGDVDGALSAFVGGVQASTGPGPTSPASIEGATRAVTWKGQLGGLPSQSIAALKAGKDTYRTVACHALEAVEGATARCQGLVAVLLGSGVPAELPRTAAEVAPAGPALSEVLGRSKIGAAGCEEQSTPIAWVSMCPDGVVTAAIATEDQALSLDTTFPSLIASMTAAGFTFGTPSRAPCALTGTETTCRVATGKQDTLTLSVLAAEKPVDGGSLVVSCAYHADVARQACSLLMTTLPKP